MFLFATLVVPLFILSLFLSLLLATCGTTLGVRRMYIEFLLKVFEYGRETIKKAEDKKTKRTETNPESLEEQHLIQLQNMKNGINGYGPQSVISRDVDILMVPEPERLKMIPRNKSLNTLQREFELGDCMQFMKAGVEAIIEDEVTQRFSAAELSSWNLLTRTNKNYHYINMKLTILWGVGFVFRYVFLLPLRFAIIVIGILLLSILTGLIGGLPDGSVKRFLNRMISLMCFRMMARGFSAMITFHNKENQAAGGGICVANHTSPIDVVILACDNCYAMIGQRHGGLMGIIQRALDRASSQIWFERSEGKDRYLVAKRLKQHVDDPKKLPILIFPEGTCINNTSVMQFKKGSFEVGGVIYPVAIKYDSRFGDPFWNSSRQTMIQYLLMMMTSWAIVCDIWYLPPMYREEGEDAITFANRVKAAIACQGGLVDLMWDGQLKRVKAKQEWKEKQQEEYSRKIKLN